MTFGVGVERFNGVEFGTAAGQEMHLDPAGTLGHTAARSLGPMCGMPVHDQVDLPAEVPGEPVAEPDHDLVGQRAVVDGEVQLALLLIAAER
jgi:hypothetical protein